MRVRITFRVKNKGAAIPFHHQYLISQNVKGLIASSEDPEFANYSYYSFSSLKGQTRVSKQGLHYQSNRVTLVLTSPNRDFIDFVLERIFEQSQMEISTLMVVPEMVLEEQEVILAEEQKMICLSPIVVAKATQDSEEGTQFINPATDEFSDMLFESTLTRMEESGIDVDAIPDIDKFQVVPDLHYIEKMKAAQKRIAWVYPIFDQEIRHEIRGYTFPFTLYAPKEVQEFLFSCGMGHYTHKGFGLLDIANAEQNRAVIEYPVKELVTT